MYVGQPVKYRSESDGLPMSTVPPQPWLMQLWYSQSSFCCDWARKPSYFVRFWPMLPLPGLSSIQFTTGTMMSIWSATPCASASQICVVTSVLNSGSASWTAFVRPGSSSQLQVRGGSSQV